MQHSTVHGERKIAERAWNGRKASPITRVSARAAAIAAATAVSAAAAAAAATVPTVPTVRTPAEVHIEAIGQLGTVEGRFRFRQERQIRVTCRQRIGQGSRPRVQVRRIGGRQNIGE